MLWASGNPVSSVRERLPQPLDSWKPEVGKGHGLSEEWAKRKCPQHCSLGMRWATWRYHPLAGPTPPQSRAGGNVRTQQQSYRTDIFFWRCRVCDAGCAMQKDRQTSMPGGCSRGACPCSHCLRARSSMLSHEFERRHSRQALSLHLIAPHSTASACSLTREFCPPPPQSDQPICQAISML